jgi:hypothetical protein
MLPADVAATFLVDSLRTRDPAARREFREFIVALTVFPLLSVACVVTAFRLLQALGFSAVEAAAGALGLLFCTSFLLYTQYHQENTLQLMLTLGAYLFLCRWGASDSWRDLLLSALLAGAGLLVRLNMALDVFGLAVLAAGLAFWKSKGDRPLLARHMAGLLLVYVPVLSAFLLLDRAYHFARFGSFTGTYLHLWAEKQRRVIPTLPEGYPFTTPFWTGFLGNLMSPKKSVFLYDPLLFVTAACWFVARRRVSAAAGWALGSAAVMLVAYLAFYGRFCGWAGDWSWGPRYMTTPVWLSCLLALPLLLRARQAVGRRGYALGAAVVGLALAVQVAAVPLPFALEYYQFTQQHPDYRVENPDSAARPAPPASYFVIGMRFKNIAELATGRFDRQQLVEDKWALQSVGATTVGLLASPPGQGPLLAASALSPGTATADPDDYTNVQMLPFLWSRAGGRLARVSMAAWLVFLVLDGSLTAAFLLRLRPGRLRKLGQTFHDPDPAPGDGVRLNAGTARRRSASRGGPAGGPR